MTFLDSGWSNRIDRHVYAPLHKTEQAALAACAKVLALQERSARCADKGRTGRGHAKSASGFTEARSQSHPKPSRSARRKIAQARAGDLGVALAGKLRSDSGRDRRRGRNPLIFFAAVQDSYRLNSTGLKLNHWPSPPGGRGEHFARNMRD